MAETEIYDDRMFPELPKTIWTLIVPWAIMMSILFFEFAGGVSTNPVILFGFPLVVTLLFMARESWSSIQGALGLSLPTQKDKLVGVLGIAVGGIIGYFFYWLGTVQGGLIGLYFPPTITQYLAETGNIMNIVMLYAVVAVGEEFMVILFTKIGANWIHSRGINKYISVFIGAGIARLAWCSLHWFAYKGLAGIPNFIFAFGLGTVFTAVCIGAGMVLKKWYINYPAISAHFVFDITLSLHLACILAAC